ncbi:uncharacterized protein LOC131681365 [Topomyia yanbarensis]|uniref:uncharacterized protein LOC131681365 n=1 Tax=Topomyia yanbarensis TaxID=2498891 RepID=UPI00273CC843|nr:uncharacterized protein LOC131681365 [Topomyia yanbarensis]
MSSTLLPAYLNETFVRTSLENGLDYPNHVAIKIHKYIIRSATKAGDNYLSDVFRMWIRYSRQPNGANEDVSLIVKCMPDVGHRGSVNEQLNVFEKEVNMFRHIVPELSKLVGGEMFAARIYYATTDPVRMIVFQDLNALGFAMADRTAGGLSFDHCAVIMRKIAKFHASSMLMAASSTTKMKELEKQFEYGFMNPHIAEESNTVLDIFASGFDTLIGCAEKWTGFDQEILAKLKCMRPLYKDRVLKCLNQKFADGYKVINHGDLWINNILFQYDATGKPKDAVFVDYLCCYTSPGIDLNYSLINCPTFDVRENQRDNLIKEYHKSLQSTLNGRYEKIPTLTDVQNEIKRMNYFSLIAAISILPLVTMDSTTDLEVSIDALVDEQKAEQLRLFQYNGKRYRDSITKLLDRFDKEGLLD